MDKIDWKVVSKCSGYLSLKAAYVTDVCRKNRHRSKEELIGLFNWVICRAKHISHAKNISIVDVLNEWENKRDQWWFGYYGNWEQPKIGSNSVKPKGINAIRKEAKRWNKN